MVKEREEEKVASIIRQIFLVYILLPSPRVRPSGIRLIRQSNKNKPKIRIDNYSNSNKINI